MSTIRLVIPEEPSAGDVNDTQTRAVNVGSLRLGLLDNSKANSDHLLARIADLVKQQFNVGSVVIQRKPRASSPAVSAVIETLARDTDIVVSAMAD